MASAAGQVVRLSFKPRPPLEHGEKTLEWQSTKTVVTGGAGFLGSFVVDKLKQRGCREIIVPRSKDYDLRDRDAIVRLYEEAKPQIVLHLAAVVGGIGANRANPGRFFTTTPSWAFN